MRYSKLNHNQDNHGSSKMFHFIRELNMIYDTDDKTGAESVSSGHSNFTDIPVYKSFEFIENSEELKGLTENQRTNFELNRKKRDEMDGNPGRKTNGFMTFEDALYEAGYAKNHISELDGSKEGRKIYVKRDSVEDYNRPEMVTFLEDSNCHSLKDFLMDAESISQDESYEFSHYNFSSTVDSDTESSDSTKEILERLSLIANELTLTTCDSKKLAMEDEEDLDERDAIQLIKEVTDECNIEQHGCERLTIRDEEDFRGREDVSIDNSVEEVASEEGSLSNRLLSLLTEGAESCEEESATNNHTEAAASTQGATEYCEQTIEPQRMSASSESLTSSRPSLTNQDDDRETSSIEADPPSGQLESIFLYSSDSTASARSFAFPILVTELPGSPLRMAVTDHWPTSPLRMAVTDHKQKPKNTDQRQLHRLQKPRRWRAFVCCKSVK